VKAAARAADGAVHSFARQRYERLSDEIREDAEAAAVAVDNAMREVLAARAIHTSVGERASRLIVVAGGRTRYGTGPPSRIDAVASAIDAVMVEHGGESTPAGPDSILPAQAEEAVAS
jgi:hypothetical protein